MVTAFVAVTLAIASPSSASGALPTPEQGEELITAGLVVQGIGIGLNVAALIESGTTNSGVFTVGTIPYHIASIPFATISVAGFAAYHNGPGRNGWLHGAGRGLLEGAAYAGLIVGLRVLKRLVHDSWCSRMKDQGNSDACFEDLTFLYDMAVIIPHGIVSLSMLTVGLITLARADRDLGPGGTVTGMDLVLTPLPGGLAVAGRYRGPSRSRLH